MMQNWIRQKRFLALASLIVFSVFSAGWMIRTDSPVWNAEKKEPAAIYKIDTSNPVLSLTFDVSWGDKRLLPILDVLKNKQVKKATFFISSPWAQSHPELVKAIQDAGFEIGNHGHRHVNYSELTDAEIRKQIQTSDHILRHMINRPLKLIRLPNGDFDRRVLQIASEFGYTVIQWDTDSHDWMNKGTKNIIHRVVSKAHNGDIILMHASDSCKQTHEALPEIIDTLRQKNFQFLTVSELIHHTDVKIMPPATTKPSPAKPV